MKQLNESQEIEEPKKVTIHKWAKNTSNSSPEESDMNSNNLCIWTTRVVPSKDPFKVSKQFIVFKKKRQFD